jgi:hypothetical protein
MKKIIFIVILLLVAIPISLAMFEDAIKIKIGGHSLCVPKKNIARESGLLDWIYKIPGLDKEVPGFLYNFSAEEVAGSIPAYQKKRNGVENTLLGIMQFLSDADREAGRVDSGLSDIWLKQGAYTERHVVYDKSVGLYKVFATPEPESSRVWYYFSQYPDEKKPVPDIYSFQVASCQYGVEMEDGSEPVICTLRFLGTNNIKVTASVAGVNFHLYGEIRNFIRDKIFEWEKACSS